MKTIGIIANLSIEKASVVVNELVGWLVRQELRVILSEDQAKMLDQPCFKCTPEQMVDQADTLVVLGGDGTLLRTAHIAGIEQVPILAVNLGHLGYFTEVTLDEMYPALQRVLDHQFELDKRMMLSVHVQRGDHIVVVGDALNEVVIQELVHLVHLDTWINDEFLAHYVADGLIVATPSGSTAYSLSAGGPIVHPSLDVIILSPICPFTLAMRPFVASGESHIRVIPEKGYEDMLIAIDGQQRYPLESGDTVCISRSAKTIQLIRSQQRSYYEVLRDKLKWGQNPGTISA